MKAEEILPKYEIVEYDDNRTGLTIYYHDKVIQAMQEYARIQIQKDRSETKRLMNEKLKDFEGLNPEIEAIIDREINLD
jgi:hypothetical protein